MSKTPCPCDKVKAPLPTMRTFTGCPAVAANSDDPGAVAGATRREFGATPAASCWEADAPTTSTVETNTVSTARLAAAGMTMKWKASLR